MKKRLLRLAFTAMVICLTAALPPLTLKAKAAGGTLADYPVGTVFKLREDGSLYNWILISHGYNGVNGNQLLMRQDLVYYATPIYNNACLLKCGYIDGEGSRSYGAVLKYSLSPVNTYLNGTYLDKFSSSLKDIIRSVDIPSYNSISSINWTYGTGFNWFITSSNTFGAKVFILSPTETAGVSGISSRTTYNGNNKTGIFIDYFDSEAKRTAKYNGTAQPYMLRDGDGYFAYPSGSPADNSVATVTDIGTFVTDKGKLSSAKNSYYYRPCIVLPANTPAIAGTEIIGAPIISGVAVSDTWGKTNTATVTASSIASSYGYSKTNSAAGVSVWSSSKTLSIPQNGTYYAFARTTGGMVSEGFKFTVSRVDNTAPSVTGVSVPTEWAKTSAITIAASDAESGVASYAVTSDAAQPSSGWQTNSRFTLSANGTYYAWAKDNAGNVKAYEFNVANIDDILPTLDNVVVPDEWGTGSTVTVLASDEQSGIAAYAVTSGASAPAYGWQDNSSFALTANGIYYAWAKDGLGNISARFAFSVTRIDDKPPVISSVTVPDGWSASAVVKINADDVGLGVASYAISTSGIKAPTSGWQVSPDFTLTASGTFYAWAKDEAGNVSAYHEFTLDKIDASKPVIVSVEVPAAYASEITAVIRATDAGGSGLAGYALTTVNMTGNATRWKDSGAFPVTANGTYYAWAKDNAGQVSNSKSVSITNLDTVPPKIESVTFNTAGTVMTVKSTDNLSGIAAVYIDGVRAGTSSYFQHQIPEGAKYLNIQVEDKAGNRSEMLTQRMPGWFDILSTMKIDSVEIDADITTAVITASSTAKAISGIYVNNVLYKGNPVTYTLTTADRYLNMQAVDADGDRSAVYRQRVPGWAQQADNLAIISCEFSGDNTIASIIAEETGDDPRGIAGIEVNGEFYGDNPLAYEIPAGTRHLEMRAINSDGDYSPLLIRRVPGWSEIVSTISISSIEFSDYNTRATCTAIATGGDSVAGIFVNNEYFEGNPIVYKIGKDTEELHVQAVNYNGDLSAMVNRVVPGSTVKSTLKLEIEKPDWTNAARVKVKITASDKLGIREVLAKAGEDGDWTDVTDTRYLWISEDTTVWASAENDDGTTKDASQSIVCFDREAPTVSGSQQDKVVNIRAQDKKSGVKAIYVNNVEYGGSKIYGGNLKYEIPSGVTTVLIRAVDEAGNESDTLELPVKSTVTAVPMIVAPSAPTSPEPELPPAAIPEPEPEPEPEPKPEPQPEPEPVIEETPEAAGMTTGQKVALAAGVFTASSAATAGTVWYLLRRRKLRQTVPELDIKDCRLKYDETDYHGSIDPLDKLQSGSGNITEVDFKQKIS